MGFRGGSALINTVAASLEDRDDRVQKVAADALLRIASKGDKTVTKALLPRLRHKRSDVKQAALQLLVQLGTKGDENAICAARVGLERCMLSGNRSLWIEALAVLCQLTQDVMVVVKAVKDFGSFRQGDRNLSYDPSAAVDAIKIWLSQQFAGKEFKEVLESACDRTIRDFLTRALNKQLSA